MTQIYVINSNLSIDLRLLGVAVSFTLNILQAT
jgi:hypothetical protein